MVKKIQETPAILKLKHQLEIKKLQVNDKQAKQWLINKARALKTSRSEMIQDKARLTFKIELGKMYFYYYDPKTKDKLPYWDKYPLTIPIQYYDDGFLGLNLHYLPPMLRALLLDKLIETANNKRFDETTKMQLNYKLLAAASKYREFQPCLKRYLYSHIWSKFIAIQADEWKVAVVLPYQSFEGASASKVWKESVKNI